MQTNSVKINGNSAYFKFSHLTLNILKNVELVYSISVV